MLDSAPVRAPEFPAGLAWVNTPRPLRLAELRGRFVLLDFWTYGCINCLHVLPDLHRLEQAFADVLTVIGVHSAKFAAERDGAGLERAVQRLGVVHPVVSDPAFAVWDQFAVKAWPTLVLIDPRGYVVARKSGEGVYGPFAQALRALLPRHEADGSLTRGSFPPTSPPIEPDVPLRYTYGNQRLAQPNLRFPGKVSADAAGRRLFVSDTGHHRVLVLDEWGRVLDTIGAGEPGFADGPLGEARFRSPQGTAFDPARGVLVVADTGNHALRTVDLREGTVATLAGTGAQAPWGFSHAAGPSDPLSSPWDVALAGGRLFVAMAGAHQVWRFDPATGRGVPWAGSGREGLHDAPRAEALFAQPSGLAVLDGALYVACPEASAIRRVPLDGPGAVETPVGEGLFDWGDADGARPASRLQHALGLAAGDGIVFVADTYNHRIKRLEPARDGRPARVLRLLGTGTAGHADGAGSVAAFAEPSGLAVLGDTLFIADTNNHALRAADLHTGTVRTVPVTFGLSVQTLDPVAVAPGARTVVVRLALPAGFKPNPSDAGQVEMHGASRPAIPFSADGAARIPLSEGSQTLDLDGMALFCADGGELCHVYRFALRLPLVVAEGGAAEATVVVPVPAPE